MLFNSDLVADAGQFVVQMDSASTMAELVAARRKWDEVLFNNDILYSSVGWPTTVALGGAFELGDYYYVPVLGGLDRIHKDEEEWYNDAAPWVWTHLRV